MDDTLLERLRRIIGDSSGTIPPVAPDVSAVRADFGKPPTPPKEYPVYRRLEDVPENTIDEVKRRIIEHEKFRPVATPDKIATGKPLTVGYGFTGKRVTPGMTMTREEADAELTRRLGEFVTELGNRRIPATPATISAIYNLGGGNLQSSGFAREMRNKNYEAAADILTRLTHAGGEVRGGLVKRRQEEADDIRAMGNPLARLLRPVAK